jgi:hypothetical protein
MNQQHFDQPQELFELAYNPDPKLAVARLSQGIFLRSKQSN